MSEPVIVVFPPTPRVAPGPDVPGDRRRRLWLARIGVGNPAPRSVLWTRRRFKKERKAPHLATGKESQMSEKAPPKGADNNPSRGEPQAEAPPAAAARKPASGMEPRRDVAALLERLDRRLRIEAAQDQAPPAVDPPPGYRQDGKGRLVPDRLIRPQDGLEDQTVRRILAFGVDLADQISRFRQHSFADVAALLEIMANEYGGGRRPGRRGNYSLSSYDGRAKVVIQAQDTIVFGPELQAARTIINACLEEWSSNSNENIQAIVQHAFQPDKQGQVSREAVLRLRRLDIDDDRWRMARRAIDDSIRVTGSRVYLRLYVRGSQEGAWKAVPIDIAGAWRDTDTLDTHVEAANAAAK